MPVHAHHPVEPRPCRPAARPAPTGEAAMPSAAWSPGGGQPAGTPSAGPRRPGAPGRLDLWPGVRLPGTCTNLQFDFGSSGTGGGGGVLTQSFTSTREWRRPGHRSLAAANLGRLAGAKARRPKPHGPALAVHAGLALLQPCALTSQRRESDSRALHHWTRPGYLQDFGQKLASGQCDVRTFGQLSDTLAETSYGCQDA